MCFLLVKLRISWISRSRYLIKTKVCLSRVQGPLLLLFLRVLWTCYVGMLQFTYRFIGGATSLLCVSRIIISIWIKKLRSLCETGESCFRVLIYGIGVNKTGSMTRRIKLNGSFTFICHLQLDACYYIGCLAYINESAHSFDTFFDELERNFSGL